MNNSHSKYLLGLYDSILADIVGTFPGLCKELMRDKKRLHSCVETRGLRVLTLDLPAVGKEFDNSLHTGRLSFSSSCLTSRRVKGSPIPRLFGGLVMRVFDMHGVLRDDACVQSVRYLRQLYNTAKKWRIPCSNTLTFKEVREFVRIDNAVQRPTLNWSEPYLSLDVSPRLSFEDGTAWGLTDRQIELPGVIQGPNLMDQYGMDRSQRVRLCRIAQQVADRISSTLGFFDPADLLAKHGPGVVSDLHRRCSKYEFPHWSERLEYVFQSARFAFANYGLWADYVRDSLAASSGHLGGHSSFGSDHATDDFVGGGSVRPQLQFELGSLNRFRTQETYSRLIAVPKTQKGPRLIAAEPTANQWCQQIILKFLDKRISHTWLGRAIDFHNQKLNQDAARAASLTGDSSTIDLSSASDRLSCWLVERFFRSNETLLRALHSTRTLVIRNPIDKKCSEFHFLNKFSTMGSAVTFPIQTLTFFMIALAARHYVLGRRVSLRSCKELSVGIRVFGDDIIVPTDSTEVTLYLLQHFGFKVNTSKTYSGANSRFRESCGVEAYMGHDVTPCYALTVPVRSKPDSYVSCVATAHNFYNRNYESVVAYLRRTTTQAGLTAIPEVEYGSGIFGWPSPFGFNAEALKQRFNKSLQRREYLARRVIWRVTRGADRGPSRLLQYFVEAPKPDILWSSGVAVKGRVLTRPVWVPLPA